MRSHAHTTGAERVAEEAVAPRAPRMPLLDKA